MDAAFAEISVALTRGALPPSRFGVADIQCTSVRIPMRDGIRLAADLYMPPGGASPVIAMLTPYDRAADAVVSTCVTFARRGYVCVSADCRGTGGSEPDSWDYYLYESEDGYDLIDWIAKQSWFAGFIGSCGGSYVGQTQWCMATHLAMSATAPQVSGLGIAVNTAHLYMFLNAYARSVGKGADKVAMSFYDMEGHYEKDTMAGGYFNEPLCAPFPESVLRRFPNLRGLPPARARRWLWEHYASLPSAQRAELIRQALGVKSVTSQDVESLSTLFGHPISHDAHTIPNASQAALCQSIQAPPLLITGWYDWGLNDALATWGLLRREGKQEVAARARLIIGPHAHNVPGYHEGVDRRPELMRLPNTANFAALLLRWYQAIREGTTESWPTVTYYLMGANEWRHASAWPVPEARLTTLYLAADGQLVRELPQRPLLPDRYTYDPLNPTPTVGGSIVSFLYPPGSVDVSEVQKRPDVLVYSTSLLQEDLDVVGPVRLILHATSSARDTDFVARLSDVFPDGRAIQLQSGILRARYRNLEGEPELLEPGRVYVFEIDMWATANRFKAGHRLRVDISSADFPHYDRNSNRGGQPGDPIAAQQTIYHDLERPSHLLLSVLNGSGPDESGST